MKCYPISFSQVGLLNEPVRRIKPRATLVSTSFYAEFHIYLMETPSAFLYPFVPLTGCGLTSWSPYGCLCKIFQAGKWWVVFKRQMYKRQHIGRPSVTCCLPSLQHLVNLFARLANDNIGYIDWDPYIPKVCSYSFIYFHRLLRSWVLVCFLDLWPDLCNLTNAVYFMALLLVG